MLLLYGDVFFSSVRLLSSVDGDVSRLYYYWRSFGFGLLRKGVLPLWNPAVLCGVPFAAYPETSIFYPPNLIFLLVPVSVGINISLVGHLFAAGIFQYLFLRRLRLGPPAALGAASILTFSAPLVLHLYAGHLSNICTMAWIPLWFFLAELVLGTRGPAAPVLLGGALGMAIFAGHWQYVFYGGLWLGLYLLARLAVLGGAGAAGRVGKLVFAAGLGAALGAVQWIPALELSRDSFRAGLGYDWAAAFSLPPINLVTLLFPGFLGDGVGAMYWGRNLYWEMCAFCGISTLGFVGLGLCGPRRRPAVLFLVLALLALLLSLGGYTPLLKLLYDHVPGFDLVRGSAKALFMAVFFLSAAAAVGIEALGRDLTRLRRAAGLSLIALALLPALASVSSPPRPWKNLVREELGRGRHNEFMPPGFPVWWRELARETPPERWTEYVGVLAAHPMFLGPAWSLARTDFLRAALVLAGFGILLGLRGWWARPAAVGLVLLELLSWAAGFVTDFDSRRCGWERGLEGFFRDRGREGRYISFDPSDYNRGMLGDAACLTGSQADAPLRTLRYLAAGEFGDPERFDLVVDVTRSSPLFALAGLRFYVTPGDMDVPYPGFRRVARGGDKAVWEGAAWDRCIVSSACAFVPDGRSLLNRLASPGYDPRREILLEDPPPAWFAAGPVPAGKVLGVEETPNRLRVRVEMSGNGILLVNDSWARGWSARVDGRETPVYRANYLMRAVFLPPGAHDVYFSYRPASFALGAALTVAGALLLVGVLAVSCLRGSGGGKHV